MIYKISFLFQAPEKDHGNLISEEDVKDFIKSELTLHEIDSANPLEFYCLENVVENLKIEPA